MLETYDVVVVGAAVSGLSAGLSASSGGAETLIVESKKEVGDSIRCGEFIPSLPQIKSLMPNAKSIDIFYRMLSNGIVSNTTKSIVVFSPKNRRYEFSFDGLVLRRNLFERKVAAEAEKAGATIQTDTTAKGLKVEKTETKLFLRNRSGERFVKANLVIAADGFPSRVGEWTNLTPRPKPEDMALCVQQTVQNAQLDSDVVEMYFGKKLAPGGYAWIIPKGEKEANVGVGVRFPYLNRDHPAVEYQEAFIGKHPVSSAHFTAAQFYPVTAKTLFVGGLMPNLYGSKVLLVGDAAGTLVPVNGSGIPTALVSGYISGEVAVRHLGGECDLSLYATVLKKEIERTVRRGHSYRRMGDMFVWSDRVFDLVLQMMGAARVGRVIKCEPIPPVFN